MESNWNPIKNSIMKIREIPIDKLCTKEEVYLYLKPIRMSEKMRILLTNSAISSLEGQMHPSFQSLQISESTYERNINEMRWTFDIDSIYESLLDIQDFPDFHKSFDSKSFSGNCRVYLSFLDLMFFILLPYQVVF